MTEDEQRLVPWLPLIAEECAEIIKETMKAQRFGLHDRPPGADEFSADNLGKIKLEIADLLAVLQSCGLDLSELDVAIEMKKRKLRIFGPDARPSPYLIEAARREAEGGIPTDHLKHALDTMPEAARGFAKLVASLTDATPPPAPDDLVRGLRDRARHARAERNAIATRDAWHFEQAADAIEALRACVQHECRWTHDADTESWDTGCGEKFHFETDGPKENGQKFCGYCGGKLIEVVPIPEPEEDE